MNVNLDWLESFTDPYIKKPIGKSMFLSGVVLGFIASCQNGRGSQINKAPLFKKMTFGKLQKRDLKRHLSEVPTLLNVYDIPYSYQITELTRLAGDYLLQSTEDMGVDGNFIYSTAFLNAWTYFYQIFPEIKSNTKPSEEKNNELQESA
jgi:hypothetical protein